MSIQQREQALSTATKSMRSQVSKTEIIPFYLLIGSYFVYQLQGVLFTSGGALSQSLLLVVIAIDLYYFGRILLLKHKNSFYYLWTSFFALNLLGFLFWGGSLSNPFHFTMLKGIVICLASFYPAYYLSRKGVLQRKELLIFFALQLVGSVALYFNYATSMTKILLETKGADLVNNVAYDFAFLIPFLLLIKKREFLTYLLLALMISFVVAGAKRGAIVVGGVMTIIFYYHQVRSSSSSSMKTTLLALIAIVSLGIAINYIVQSDEFLTNRFSDLLEGNSSGRGRIYSAIWNGWKGSSNEWIPFLFGFGFAGSQSLTGGLFAHNDWLEMLSNFGLVGITLYLSLIICGFWYAFSKHKLAQSDERLLMLMIMAGWFLSSLFSMWYTSMGCMTQSMLLGYLMGKSKR